jgi:hypothetical protein
MYNDSILLTNQTFETATTPLFIIGNGDGNATRSNALVVQKNGNVAIGNFSPQFKLDVGERMRLRSGGTPSTSPGIWFNNINNSSSPGFIGMYNDFTLGMYGNGLGVGFGFVMDLSNGNIGIGTQTPSQKLHVVGNICATGTIAVCSDIRYKKNILPVSNALSSILSLHGIYYNWDKEKFKDKEFTDKRQLGFSAQEIEKLFPEIVLTDAEGYKSVDYSRLTPVLVEAVKEQQQQIDYLKKELDELKKLVQKISSKN